MIVINVSGLLLGRLVQEVHKFHRTSFHFVYYTVYQHHQVVVSKHGNDTHDQTAYGGDHGFVDTAGKQGYIDVSLPAFAIS